MLRSPLLFVLNSSVRTKGNMSKGKATKKGASSSTAKASEAEEEKAVALNKNGQIVLRIHAKPGAKVSQVTDVGECEVGVAIAAPPRDGAANEELLRHVQSVLGLRKSDVDFDKGAKSRSKVLLISADKISVDEVIRKLRSDVDS